MGETSIPCNKATRDRLREDKTPGVSWDRYLNDLLDAAERADDYESDIPREELAKLREQVDKVPEHTADELEGRFR